MATRYFELVVKGEGELLRGFIDGFMTAKKITSGIIMASLHPIDTHHLREVFTLHGDHIHVIVAARHRQALMAAIREARDIDCRLVSEREIKRAHFAFSFRVFNRDVAAELRQMLGDLPPELKLIDYDPRETIDPSAKGVEVYSPVHEYCFEGKGKIQGDIEKLLSVRQRLARHVSIEMKDIELEH